MCDFLKFETPSALTAYVEPAGIPGVVARGNWPVRPFLFRYSHCAGSVVFSRG